MFSFPFLLVSNKFCLCQQNKSLCCWVLLFIFSQKTQGFFFLFFCKISTLWLWKRNHCGESISWNDDRSKIIFLCRKQRHLKTGLTSLFFVLGSVDSQAPGPLILPHSQFLKMNIAENEALCWKGLQKKNFSLYNMFQFSDNLQDNLAVHGFSSQIFIFLGPPGHEWATRAASGQPTMTSPSLVFPMEPV